MYSTKIGIEGVGIDIEDISRFEKLNYNENKEFYQRIFTKNEIEYCISKKNPYQHFAARFCAKEAFIKATKKTINDYKNMEIGIENKKPFLIWNKKKYLLSLSHEKNKAAAVVIFNK